MAAMLNGPHPDAPTLAAGNPRLQDLQVAQAQREVEEVAAILKPGEQERFYEWAQLDRGDRAGFLLTIYFPHDGN